MARADMEQFDEGSKAVLDKQAQRAFSRWAVAICVVEFDLDYGQTMKECFPEGTITEEEARDVAFSAFPDSISGLPARTSVQDSVFCFRVARRGDRPFRASDRSSSPNASSSSASAADSAKAKPSHEAPSKRAFLYGYVFCRQRQDARLKRGGDQQSVIVLSCMPYATVFKPLVRAAGPMYFDIGRGALEKVAARVAQWSRPTPGAVCDLPLGEVVICTQLPVNSSLPLPVNDGSDDELEDERLASHLTVTPSTSPAPSPSKPAPSSAQPPQPPAPPSGGRPSMDPSRVSRDGSSAGRLDGERTADEQRRAMLRFMNSEEGVEEPAEQGGGGAEAVGTSEGGAGEQRDGRAESAASTEAAGSSEGEGPGRRTTTEPVVPFQDADIYGSCNGVLQKLWVLWELMLLGEPLMVLAPTPAQCSEAVTSLLCLIAPIPTTTDFRPYFTIHDPAFASLSAAASTGAPTPAMILGVTNVFFVKSLPSWPHVLSVGLPLPNSVKTGQPSSPLTSERLPGHTIASKLSNLSSAPLRAFRSSRVQSKGPKQLLQQHMQALWTSYDAVTKADTKVLNALIDTDKEVNFSRQELASAFRSNSELLRRHFAELTAAFLAPFNPFIRGSLPRPGTCPFTSPPPLKDFEVQAFLRDMQANGCERFVQRRMRANWIALYQRFVHCANFQSWMQRKRTAATRQQHRSWCRARFLADIHHFLPQLSEVRLVDAFSSVERQLQGELATGSAAGSEERSRTVMGRVSKAEVMTKLRRDLWAIYEALPRDVQQTLSFTPAFAAILQGQDKAPSRHPGHVALLARSQSGHHWSKAGPRSPPSDRTGSEGTTPKGEGGDEAEDCTANASGRQRLAEALQAGLRIVSTSAEGSGHTGGIADSIISHELAAKSRRKALQLETLRSNSFSEDKSMASSGSQSSPLGSPTRQNPLAREWAQRRSSLDANSIDSPL